MTWKGSLCSGAPLFAISRCHTSILKRVCMFAQLASKKLSRKSSNFFRVFNVINMKQCVSLRPKLAPS